MGSTVRVICCQSFHSPQRDIYRRCIEKERREVEVESRSEYGREVQKRDVEERNRYSPRTGADIEEQKIRTEGTRTDQKDPHIYKRNE